MLQIPATIESVKTLKEKNCLSLIVHTNELSSASKAEVMNYHQQFGWMVFAETPIQESDIPTEPLEFENQKTLSERLRNVLYVLHEKRGGKPEDFEDFRKKYMEKIIANIKTKISEMDELN